MVNMEVSPDSGSKKQRKTSGASSAKKSKFYCSTCHVHCPNESTLEQHNSGKKHLGNVANARRRDKHAMCSVFVGNLPKLAAITARLVEEGTAAPSGVIVPGAAPASSGKESEKLRADLMALLGKFGQVNKLIVDKKHGSYCIAEYESPAQAQTALKEHQAAKIPLFYGRKLQIKSRNVTEIKPLSQITTQNAIDRANMEALLEEADDDAVCALNMVDAAISVSESARRTQHEALVRLQNQLNDSLPFNKIKLQLFGSGATGLALRDSDLDVSLAAERRLEREDLISVLKGKCTGVSHVHMIPAPGQGTIVRFLDGVSNTTIDLLFSNRLGLTNTGLLNTMLSYDTRLPRLVRLIVYWTRAVTEGKFPKQALPSSYTLTIMVFHLLRKEGIIPDFFNTDFMVPLSDTKLIYDLDCSYATDLGKLPRTSDTSTIPELMAMFWKYYGSFNRDDHVVSIRGVLNKSDLISDDPAPVNDKHNYVTVFKQSSLAVQDPLVPTHNISHNVSLEAAVYWGDACRAAATSWAAGKPLYKWWLGSKLTKGRGEEEAGNAIVEEEEMTAEGGDKTPVWEGSGCKRSADAMEH